MMIPLWLDTPGFPLPLADLLLAGTLGRDHLLRAAAMARTAGEETPDSADWPRLRRQLLAAALEEDPLYGPTAATLAQALRAAPPGRINAGFAALVEALAARFRPPESVAYYERLLAGGNTGRIEAYLENEIRNGRAALFWLHIALHRAILGRDFDRGAALAELALAGDLTPLGHKVAGDLALLRGDAPAALTAYDMAQALAPWPAGLFRRPLAALAAGREDVAAKALAALLRDFPEHVSAGLALYDLTSDRRHALGRLAGDLCVALYTCNKADDLDKTLASLFASDFSRVDGTVRTLLLDNASGDATPDVVAAWADRVGTGRLAAIRLPVNVGAPAARNWLASDDRLGRAAHVAYLDDDVDLPADWIARLAAAAEAYPEAGVWGCRVLDAANPAIAQGVDVMLLPPEQGQEEPQLSGLHAQGFDFGGFAHMRPCLTVMGCCHLFHRERLLGAGGFDIRFSPSQYDDVDHDWRLALAGTPPVYQGHLAVAHRRPAPALVRPRPDQLAGGQANWRKLAAKHAGRYAAMAAAQRATALNDLRRKYEELAKAGLDAPCS
ncbi:glycosyltransferase family 2 protein [Solidesulfovibrio carbinolicus]|uniref:Glycosyl transferase family 2 n=1 Tax=Solidesulfovibrio carbinolicus TaxID=296842 RepID=A0A4P6HL03_9BACT|nr:glycosyltransferase [Solidesulfovibrio carbinolicus]QAZ67873.1 glycosyl transferase family 2 [Solidesulfovibrio carbinolicus]